MSKHLGNILEPIALMDAARRGRGALVHAVRRFAVVGAAHRARGARGDRPQGDADVLEHRVVLSPCTPATTRGPRRRPGRRARRCWTGGRCPSRTPGRSRSTMRWRSSTPPRAGRLLAEFIDDLSNWYVRRSRRRFWDGDAAALSPCTSAWTSLTRLLAPFVPFVTEEVWQQGRALAGNADAAESVHLADWPAADADADRSRRCRQQVHGAHGRSAEAGRAARQASKIRIRQPLAQRPRRAAGRDRAARRAARRRRRRAERQDAWHAGIRRDGHRRDVKANFRELGKRFGKQTQAVAKAIGGREPGPLVERLRGEGSASVTVDGEPIAVGPDDVLVTEAPRSGLGGGVPARGDHRAGHPAHARVGDRGHGSGRRPGAFSRPAARPGLTSPTASRCRSPVATRCWRLCGRTRPSSSGRRWPTRSR